MELVGILDSPYVRRVAISLQLLDLTFTHQSLSVFSTFARLQAINPVVRAPSLACDVGTVLMDSTLILEFAEGVAVPGKSLMPAAALQRQRRHARSRDAALCWLVSSDSAFSAMFKLTMGNAPSHFQCKPAAKTN